jgi:hypothetical protein
VLRYGQDPELVCLMRLAHTLWFMGRSDDAARSRDEALALAEDRGHPYSGALVAVFAALVALDQRDEQRLREHSSALGSAERGHGARPIRRTAEAFAGYVDVLDGRSGDGIDRIRRSLDEVTSGAPAAPGEAGIVMRILLEACAVAGEAQAGLAAADRARDGRGGTAVGGRGPPVARRVPRRGRGCGRGGRG